MELCSFYVFLLSSNFIHKFNAVQVLFHLKFYSSKSCTLSKGYRCNSYLPSVKFTKVGIKPMHGEEFEKCSS